MGLLDKVKNLFTEEVEDDVIPVRQEVKKPEPVKEFKPAVTSKQLFDDDEDDFEIAPKPKSIEKEEVKTREEKFIYFTDDDFKDLEKPKPKVEEVKPKPVIKKEEKKSNLYNGSPVKPVETKKEFRPSPIISPVYGVLDKDYTKEEIKAKSSPRIYKSTITIDEVKDKETTIEDDINDEILGKALIEKIEPKENNLNINIFDELEKEEPKDDVDLIFDNLDDKLETIENEIKEEPKKVKDDVELAKSLVEDENEEDETIALAEELALQKEKIEKINNLMEENEKITKNKNKSKKKKDTEEDDLEESELFDLIDSMYEKKDDE